MDLAKLMDMLLNPLVGIPVVTLFIVVVGRWIIIPLIGLCIDFGIELCEIVFWALVDLGFQMGNWRAVEHSQATPESHPHDYPWYEG